VVVLSFPPGIKLLRVGLTNYGFLCPLKPLTIALTRRCHWRMDEGGSHSFPVSMQNLRSLRSTNIEKHLSHNKKYHKVKVLAKIYFSITG
jgi:hypothetical protein